MTTDTDVRGSPSDWVNESTNRRRCSSSRHMVNSSSNWSTITRMRGARQLGCRRFAGDALERVGVVLQARPDQVEQEARYGTGERASQTFDRFGARGQQHREPLLAAGECARPDRGAEAGEQQRRLPATRDADDPYEPLDRNPRHQLGDQAFAPEEVVGIGRLEVGQALVRATRERGRRRGVQRCRRLVIVSTVEIQHAVGDLVLQEVEVDPSRSGARNPVLDGAKPRPRRARPVPTAAGTTPRRFPDPDVSSRIEDRS